MNDTPDLSTNIDLDIRLDLDMRRMKPEQLSGPIGEALRDRDVVKLAYILGRLDEKIGSNNKYQSLVTDEANLRQVICAALNLFPDTREPERPASLEIAPEPA